MVRSIQRFKMRGLIFMINIKNIFKVTALSLGLVVGAVGVAGAATSTNYHNEIADWFKNDPNPVVMHTNTVATPPVVISTADIKTHVTPVDVTKTHVTPAADTKTHITPLPVTKAPVNAAPVTPSQINYHYNDGHSNMNPEQHQQMHITQPSENHMSGSESGHESDHESDHESGHK